MQDLFVDRLGNVIVSGGVARLDFMRVRPGNPEKKEMVLEPSIRVAIPVDGLAQMIGMLEEMKKQIEKQGAARSSRKVPVAPEAKTKQ